MRVVALFRVSTERQANEGASLDAQQRRYRELAQANGWTTVAEFRGCESATQAATERMVLQQVLLAIREQGPEAVYVHEQSRLTRGDELEVALLFRELRERNIKVIVGGVVRDLESIDERFMLGIQSLVDRAESDRIKERMKRGKRERARQGKKNCGGTPFGYFNPPPGDPRRGTLQIVPEHAAIVRRIFQLAASGEGIRRTARLLNSEALPGPRNRPWTFSRVRGILLNPVYAGVHVSGAWIKVKGPTRNYVFDIHHPEAIVVPNAHESIIDRSVWDAVQAKPKPVCTNRPHLLTGLLWINDRRSCVQTAHEKVFYHASGRHNAPKQPWLPVEETNNLIWQAFVSVTRGASFVESLLKEANQRTSLENATSESQRLEGHVAKCKNRLARLLDMRADGEIDKDVYLEKAGKTNQEIAQAEAHLKRLRLQLACTDRTQAERVVKAIQTLVGSPTRMTQKQKRNVLTSVLRRVNVTAQRDTNSFVRDARGRITGAKNSAWSVQDAWLDFTVPGGDGDADLSATSGVQHLARSWKQACQAFSTRRSRCRRRWCRSQRQNRFHHRRWR